MRIMLLCLALAATSLGPRAQAQQTSCDRDCLRTALTRYMNAVVANRPDAAGLIVGYRQTENAIVKRAGTGVWTSVTALGDVQRHFLDPVTGQAAYFGIVEEGDTPAVVTARIRVLNGLVAEAEWYLARKGQTGIRGEPQPDGTGANLYDPDYLSKNPPPERNVPAAQRLGRASLLGIANSYFDAITTHDGAVMMSHADCKRLENGLLTTGRALPAGSTDGYQGRTNCSSGLQASGNLNIAFVAARRYPVVDEVQQVVMATGVFIRFPGSPNRRNGLSEYFYIDDGLISEVYAAMFYPEPTAPVPNWPPYDGNFALPAELSGSGRGN
jgi:hypothetical protein